MRIAAHLDGVERAAHALHDALDEEIAMALERCGRIVAAAAKTEHSFTNRTGDLEASIESLNAVGTFSRDTLSVSVVARMPYGSYLEEGDWPFLASALAEHSSEMTGELEIGIERAIARAGWR